MKTSEIKKEARKLLNTIFYKAMESDDKEVWKKTLAFIDCKITQLENWDRGQDMFIWRNAKQQFVFEFWKKFINASK